MLFPSLFMCQYDCGGHWWSFFIGHHVFCVFQWRMRITVISWSWEKCWSGSTWRTCESRLTLATMSYTAAASWRRWDSKTQTLTANPSGEECHNHTEWYGKSSPPQPMTEIFIVCIYRHGKCYGKRDSLLIYAPSCHSKPVRLWFIFKTN